MRFGPAFLLLLLAALSLWGTPNGSGEPSHARGEIRGSVVLDLEGVKLADLGPMVVTLDGTAGPLEFEVPEAAVIHQRDARFVPEFLVTTVGQTIEVPNDDDIFHNVFSFSPKNEFDLGIYAQGVTKSVTFQHPGVVRIYCSIHESMNGTIFVAPSPHWARVKGSGAFSIADVAPGHYRLRVWSEKLPAVERVVEVLPGRTKISIRIPGPQPGDAETGQRVREPRDGAAELARRSSLGACCEFSRP